MKQILYITFFSLLFITCTAANKQTESYELKPPTAIIGTKTNNTLLLTWTNQAVNARNMVIELAISSDPYTLLKSLDANANSYIYENLQSKVYKFKFYTLKGNDKSEPVIFTLDNIDKPAIILGTVQKSNYAITIPFTLNYSSEESSLEVGVCWNDTPNPTIENNKSLATKKITDKESFYIQIKDLTPAKTYYFKIYATNIKGVGYSEEISVTTPSALSPLTVTWQENTTLTLPTEVKLYSISTTINSRPIKAWYAIADLSTGNVELMCAKKDVLTKTSAFVQSLTTENVYVMINGSYFGGTPSQSYAYVKNRNVAQSTNIASLTRGSNAYTVTRGAIGVDNNQVPSIHWILSESGTTYTYDKPLPVVEGETPLTLTANFPTNRTAWSNYSGIGGAPILVKDGKICFDYSTSSSNKYLTNYELLQSDIFAENLKQPRTAIGYMADKKVVLLVVDGRQTGISEGATLDEVAQIMLGIGCTNVLNLDGGGSTTMVDKNGTLLNTPSDASGERQVLSFVGFVEKLNL